MIFTDLNQDVVQKITEHMDYWTRINFSKTSRNHFKYHPQEKVFFYFPFRNTKPPTPFLCEHLKRKKYLKISVFNSFDEKILSNPESVERKFLNCLSGVEILIFDANEEMILNDPNFKMKNYFPRLNHLQFQLKDSILFENIPNDLKSLRLQTGLSEYHSTALKDKLSEMTKLESLSIQIFNQNSIDLSAISLAIGTLKHITTFKRLEIDYMGPIDEITGLMTQLRDVNYSLEIKVDFHDVFAVAKFIQKLPETTKSLSLYLKSIENLEQLCMAISRLKKLEKFLLSSNSVSGNPSFYYQHLPVSLKELEIIGNDFETSDNIQYLPSKLKILKLQKITPLALEFVANHVEHLYITKLLENEKLLEIKEPFKAIKFFEFEQQYISPREIIPTTILSHLYDLLPQTMEIVKWRLRIPDEKDLELLSTKVLESDKMIQCFELGVFISKTKRTQTRIFQYNGHRMRQQ